MFRKKMKSWLVAFTWNNEISKTSGNSSLVVELQSNEYMNAEKIEELQISILSEISTYGHVNDPDNVCITSVSLLESKTA